MKRLTTRLLVGALGCLGVLATMLVPTAPANAVDVNTYVTVSGFSRVDSDTFTVTYSVSRGWPITHRVQLKVTNQTSTTTKLINETRTLSSSTGRHTITFDGVLPIQDVLRLRLEYQEYLTGGVYSTTGSSNTYKFFGPSSPHVGYTTVTAGQATAKWVIHQIPCATVSMGIALTKVGMIFGASTLGCYGVQQYNSQQSQGCSDWLAGQYLRITSTWGMSGTSLQLVSKVERWRNKTTFDNRGGTNPGCVYTTTWGL